MDANRDVPPPATPAYEQPPAAPAPQPPAAQPVVAPPVGSTTDPRRKSPLLALLLSMMPGLGQIYVGYYQRGFVHAIVAALMIGILSSGALSGGAEPMIGLPLAFFWLYNMIDAARKAQLFNEALAGGKPIEVPEDLSLPGIGGSVLGGSLILVAGFVLLMHTKFDLSLMWLNEWWPVGIMAFGGYLVYKAVRDRAASGEIADE